MTKTYLALSEDKQKIELIVDAIEKTLDQTTPTIIHNKDQVIDVLKSPFELLIVDSGVINDISELPISNNNGQVWYITENNSNQESKSVKLHFYSSVNDVRQAIILKTCINEEVLKEKGNESKEESNRQKEPASPQEISFEEEEPNGSKPITLEEPFPELDKEVVKKIDTESREVDVEEEMAMSQFVKQPTPNIEYSSLWQQSQKIRKHFRKIKCDNKAIGVWSPIKNIGVTTFIINYALYLKKTKITVAALEGLTNDQIMKDRLRLFAHEPKQWNSIMKLLNNNDLPIESGVWTYQNVTWFPQDIDDVNIFNELESEETKREFFETCFSSLQDYELLFVDLPTGKMESYTLDSLSYLDELWIVINGDYQKLLKWKDYIHSIMEKYQLKVNLIFIKLTSKDKEKEIAEALNLPTLITLPNLTEEIHASYYEKKPLIHQKNVMERLEKPFEELTIQLLKEKYSPTPNNGLFFKAWKLFQSHS